jgi:FkbM family methyltransferase
MFRRLRNFGHILGRYSVLFARLAYRQVSFAQEGEDRVLARYFGNQAAGFYVDVGAHHPFRFSNTALLHRRGWRGVNIDAWPGSMAPFRRARPDDVNLEVGVSKDVGEASFFIFNDAAMNTFDPELAERHNRPPFSIERTVQVPLRPLRDILAEHVANGQQIDLMSIDVEGRDLEVLESNDWTRYRPRMLLVEVIGGSWATLADDPAAKFAMAQGYSPYAKTVNTLFFLRSD